MIWTTSLKKSGIEKCRFHELRHTFVSNLMAGEKEDFTIVMTLSGHKDISMLNRYSYTQEEAKKNAIKNWNQDISMECLSLMILIRKG